MRNLVLLHDDEAENRVGNRVLAELIRVGALKDKAILRAERHRGEA